MKSLALLLSSLLLASVPARAGDIVRNLSNSTNGVGEVLDFAGDTGAHGFTTGPLPVRLESVTVELKAPTGGTDNTARIRVWSGAGALPVTLVEDLGTVNLVNSAAAQNVTAVSALQPVLTANTRYWVSVTNVTGDFDWNLTPNTATTGTGSIPQNPSAPISVRAVSTNDGASWGTFSSSLNHKFAVVGSQIHTVINNNDSGAGSLRQAIADVPAGDTIVFEPTALDGQTITLTSGQFLLDKDVTIDGSALSGGLSLDAQGTSRIMLIDGANGTPSVSLHGLTLTGGNAGVNVSGAAIENSGATLALERCTLHGNTSLLEGGGAISSGNSGASLALAHCTLTENSAEEGGAISASGSLSLRHCTLTGNTAGFGGGVGFSGSGTFTLENSIVAGNTTTTTSTGGDIEILNSANLTRVGANLVQNFANFSTGTVSGPAPTNAAPLLAPLGDYGGPTSTMPPQPGSPAIDAALGFPGATDQRGFAIGTYVYENDFSNSHLGGATVITSGSDIRTGTIDAGSFRLTPADGHEQGTLILPAPAEMFTTFAASFDLSYSDPSGGTGSGGPADGISFSFGPNSGVSGDENGVSGAHRISFNIYNGNNPSQNGLLRYIDPAGNVVGTQFAFPRFTDAGSFRAFTVTLDASGTLTVTYKGAVVITRQITYTYAEGDTFTFAARTGGDTSEQRVDNIRILTSPIGGAPDIGAVEYDPTPVTAVVQNNLDDTTTFGTLRATLGWVPPGSTITFAQTLDGSTIALNGTNFFITRNVTIDATALSGGLTLNAQDASQIMRIDGSNGAPSVSLHGLTLTGGNSSIDGGAIENIGATLALTHCTLFGNTAGSTGGAIFSSGGPGASLALTHCTLTGNSAEDQGGAISATGKLTLRHCTISDNEAGDEGGGVIFSSGTFTLENSIVAVNNAGSLGADIFNRATVTRTGANIVQDLENDDPGGSVTGSGTIITAAPLLAPLGDYGGPTPTMPPLPGSPAIDAAPGSTETTDQRGFLRPVDGDGNTTAIADIGAAEFTPSTDFAAFFGLDTDGDGNLFGLEFALGTDPDVSDPGHPNNLTAPTFNSSGHASLTFGRNQAAQPFMIWRLTRSTTLLPGSFDEIFRYDGPTSTATNTGTNSTINPTSFEITDPTPPAGKAFYRFEAVLPE